MQLRFDPYRSQSLVPHPQRICRCLGGNRSPCRNEQASDNHSQEPCAAYPSAAPSQTDVWSLFSKLGYRVGVHAKRLPRGAVLKVPNPLAGQPCTGSQMQDSLTGMSSIVMQRGPEQVCDLKHTADTWYQGSISSFCHDTKMLGEAGRQRERARTLEARGQIRPTSSDLSESSRIGDGAFG